MNVKQLEEMTLNQGRAIEGLTKRVEEQAAVIAVHAKVVIAADNFLQSWAVIQEAIEHEAQILVSVQEVIQDLYKRIEQLKTWIGADESDGPFYGEFKALAEIVTGLQEKVEARNKSAPAKRNMTDSDAMNVMNGECKTLEHKDAAEKLGLTYAQVYSCRLEYTFKHVHKTLKDEGFKNPWAKV